MKGTIINQTQTHITNQGNENKINQTKIGKMFLYFNHF